MKTSRFLCCLLLFLFCSTALSKDTDAERRERLEKWEETKRKRKEKALIRAQFDYSYNDIHDKLVVIEHDMGSGSGFIAKMDGKTYLITNQHVILGGDKIAFTTISGEKLRPRKVELSSTRDIARLLLDGDSGFETTTQVDMDEPIGVFGNSEGAGVATELYGTVTGVGGEVVEVSAEFVSGNSGSPVLNLNREAVGIATYVRYSEESRMKEGTQFENKTRRFCYRLTNVQWVAVNWKKYNEKFGKVYRQNEILTNRIQGIVSVLNDDLLSMFKMAGTSAGSLDSWKKKHNQIIGKQYRREYHNRDFPIAYSGNMRTLAGICRTQARQIRMLSKERGLSGFLQKEFEQQAEFLESMAKEFDLFADTIHQK
ncbi:MAG: hypothetical protein DRP64_14350 [Verrucomicrobia bacterium]|nr:MAG: hypothetical protein DRP64_14350 [Verrucomicrobiota bacterium]